MTVILFFPHGRLFSRSKTEMKASRLTLYSDDSQQVQHFDSQTAQQNNDYSLQSVLALLLSFHSSFLLWISCSLWSPVLFIQNIILKNSLFFPNDRLCKQLPSFVDLNTETCTHLHLFISFYPPHLTPSPGMSLVSWPPPDPTNSFLSLPASFTTLLGYSLSPRLFLGQERSAPRSLQLQ